MRICTTRIGESDIAAGVDEQVAERVRGWEGVRGTSGVGSSPSVVDAVGIRRATGIYQTVSDFCKFTADLSNFPIANAAPVRSEQGHLLARYAISLSNGQLVSSRRLSDSDKPKQDERVWYAYVEPLASSGFFGYNTYTDLLSSEMTERFVELTHDVYKQHVGEDFGGVVPSIFTDEPQYCPMSNLDQAEGLQDVFLPWTSGILASFKKDKGGDLVDLLPEIIHDKVESTGRARYDFLDHVAELFTRNYIGVLAKWCRENDLVCTGHMNAVRIRLLGSMPCRLNVAGTNTLLSDGSEWRSDANIPRHATPRNRHAVRRAGIQHGQTSRVCRAAIRTVRRHVRAIRRDRLGLHL